MQVTLHARFIPVPLKLLSVQCSSLNYISMVCFFELFIFFCVFSAKVTCAFIVYKKQLRNSQKINTFRRIRLRFQGYRCKSGNATFAWRVTWNYVCSPYNTNREGTPARLPSTVPVVLGQGHEKHAVNPGANVSLGRVGSPGINKVQVQIPPVLRVVPGYLCSVHL